MTKYELRIWLHLRGSAHVVQYTCQHALSLSC